MDFIVLCIMFWDKNELNPCGAWIDYNAIVDRKIKSMESALTEEELTNCEVIKLSLDKATIKDIPFMNKVIYWGTLNTRLSREMFNRCNTKIAELINEWVDNQESFFKRLEAVERQTDTLQKQLDMV